MNAEYRWFCAALSLLVLMPCGCKPKQDQAPPPQQATGPSAAEIAAARDAITGGMVQVSLDKLDKSEIGKKCVITARTPDGGLRIPPPPPPLGMARLLGPTTLYAGELSDVTAESVKVRAPYPSSENYKTIEVPRADIQSIHLAR